jgi:DNA-binding CsgD family transcriptional regulator
MRMKLAEQISAELLEVDTQAGLMTVVRQASRRLGFDHFALALENRTQAGIAQAMLLHDYPDEWAKVNINFDLRGRDPVRRACDRSLNGFAWERIESLIPMTRGDRQMLAVGRECGIGDGYTVPRHLPGEASGACSFVVRPERGLPRSTLLIAEIVGAVAIGCALKLSDIRRAPRKPVLSDRQRECLLWSARGKTAAETAIILGISAETVIQHLKTARERYGVHCSQTLILCALVDGLIGLGDIFRWSDFH